MRNWNFNSICGQLQFRTYMLDLLWTSSPEGTPPATVFLQICKFAVQVIKLPTSACVAGVLQHWKAQCCKYVLSQICSLYAYFMLQFVHIVYCLREKKPQDKHTAHTHIFYIALCPFIGFCKNHVPLGACTAMGRMRGDKGSCSPAPVGYLSMYFKL